jgi:hypothetical protein
VHQRSRSGPKNASISAANSAGSSGTRGANGSIMAVIMPLTELRDALGEERVELGEPGA